MPLNRPASTLARGGSVLTPSPIDDREDVKGVYVTVSVGVQLVPNLTRFLEAPVVYRPRFKPAHVRAVLGWGLKGKSLQALAQARQHGLPYVALEDGFLRSVGLGNTDPPSSIVVDDVGIYYNAQEPSRLEHLVGMPCTEAQASRASELVRRWQQGRLSKYNHSRDPLQVPQGPYVLAVDQTLGDASIAYGLANAASFQRMLEAALDEHPTLPVVLKVHPDVIAGRKQAHFGRLTQGQSTRVSLLATDAHPARLVEGAETVYVVTSQMGFEALVWGKPVRTFGMPFYAGWGLTSDELPRPARRDAAHAVTLDDLVHAALVSYPRYLDPETLERCEVERIMDWLSLQRQMRTRFPATLQAVGFSKWKKPVARAFFAGSELQFLTQPKAPARSAPHKSAPRAVWGRPKQDGTVLKRDGPPLLRVEDGFLRSVGLGADWVRPLSWVIDGSGMYYDATRPSDIETLLQQACFDEELLARARRLRTSIVDAGITKYNVGSRCWQPQANGKPLVFVVGQVESDASITYGTPGLRTNFALVKAAREAAPQAHLVYKPHPDVVARKRLRGKDEHAARQYCDEIVTDVPVHLLLEAADEVHVLTSLAGFEALLRDKKVVCHGQPFYAGWGLTHDKHPHPRRTRLLDLDELVAATLILYPTYVSRASGAYTSPERALYELLHWNEQPERPTGASWMSMIRLLRRTRDWWRRHHRSIALPP